MLHTQWDQMSFVILIVVWITIFADNYTVTKFSYNEIKVVDSHVSLWRRRSRTNKYVSYCNIVVIVQRLITLRCIFVWLQFSDWNDDEYVDHQNRSQEYKYR